MLTHKLALEKLNREFENKTQQEIVDWAAKEFAGRIAITSSFGPESGVLLHMLSRADKTVPVLFLETGYHFPETLAYRDKLAGLFGLKNVIDLRADSARKAEIVAKHEGVPYDRDPDLCCQINKVEPLDEAIKGYEAWMSGIRRHQTDYRKSIRFVEEYEGEIYKISPLANFTSRDAWWYLNEHNIPQHPLYERGYLSIGCWPCTRAAQPGDDERAGRWAGKTKTECGIHTFKEVKEKEEKDKEPPQHVADGI
ncbi:MAG: phosphoadenylyl-sulfate reductase [Candidatus Omnitrophota bacterium]|nr:phosphoadenylyl-sulfate reductase [Candidatus Omnitrophota bacterium]